MDNVVCLDLKVLMVLRELLDVACQVRRETRVKRVCLVFLVEMVVRDRRENQVSFH